MVGAHGVRRDVDGGFHDDRYVSDRHGDSYIYISDGVHDGDYEDRVSIKSSQMTCRGVLNAFAFLVNHWGKDLGVTRLILLSKGHPGYSSKSRDVPVEEMPALRIWKS